MLSDEDQARLEERQAQEWLLYREQCNDLRQQLQAAVELFQERSGLSEVEANQILAARVAENRSKQ